MPKGKRLVLEHLEKVSWELLDTYPDVVKGLIKGRAGVYALYRRDRLYYIGLAKNLMRRLKTHLRDRHRGTWDRFSVYLTARDEHIKELESLILRIVGPPGNKTGGRFVASRNLHSDVNEMIKEADADRRARVIGGSTAKRRRKRKATSASGARALAGVFERRTALRGYHKGWEYGASLRTDGTISFDQEVYKSPSAAAKAAIGRHTNGWSFWRYRDSSGRWRRLRTLKK